MLVMAASRSAKGAEVSDRAFARAAAMKTTTKTTGKTTGGCLAA